MISTEVTTLGEYHLALRRVFDLMVSDPPADSAEGEELARLAAAVERFEAERFPVSCCVFAAQDCAERLLNLICEVGVVCSVEQAVEWFETKNPLLDGQRPVDLLLSDKGAAEVNALAKRLVEATRKQETGHNER